jgi:hypothetical protein
VPALLDRRRLPHRGRRPVWIPFIWAIAVLRPELQSLERFMAAEAGEFRNAADVVSRLMTTLPGGKPLRDFFRDYRAMRTAAWYAADDDLSGETAVADLDGRFESCREACISQLVAIRFERLVQAIRFPGSLILLAFLMFTWAANPPKDAIKLFDQPYAEPLNPDRLARLKAAKIDPACYAPGAQLVAVAAPRCRTADGGPDSAEARHAGLQTPQGDPISRHDSQGRLTQLRGGGSLDRRSGSSVASHRVPRSSKGPRCRTRPIYGISF